MWFKKTAVNLGVSIKVYVAVGDEVILRCF